jgi:predicted HAD superfamily Cof-like phosphohydrolase
MVPEIIHFNREVLGIVRESPKLMPDEEALWLRGALTEEIEEFMDAHATGHLPMAVDGLLDLIYFAVGGLYRMGLDDRKIRECFLAVHVANLTKQRGIKATRPQDGSVADAVKDDTFRDPVLLIEKLLNG